MRRFKKGRGGSRPGRKGMANHHSWMPHLQGSDQPVEATLLGRVPTGVYLRWGLLSEAAKQHSLLVGEEGAGHNPRALLPLSQRLITVGGQASQEAVSSSLPGCSSHPGPTIVSPRRMRCVHYA